MRTLAVGTILTLALTSVLAASPAGAATPLPTTDHVAVVTPQARAAGIDEMGGAYMGWSARGHGGPQQAVTARTMSRANSAAASRGSSGVAGIDVSSRQRNVAWASWWNRGKRFAYVKATEGTGYRNPYFTQQYNGSYKVGMIRGSYHFALPNKSSGAAQANYFVAHGGGWSADGKTLPGVLDIEYNPYGATCYGLSNSQMRSWIASFTNRYKSLTRRDAVIYSDYDWWNRCTGNTTHFNRTNPLWVARYASSPGTLPGRWPYQTFWQYAWSPIDQDRFNGSFSRLKVLALG